eukprot:1160750-Pelagomonas_calceolata.AAC.5
MCMFPSRNLEWQRLACSHVAIICVSAVFNAHVVSGRICACSYTIRVRTQLYSLSSIHASSTCSEPACKTLVTHQPWCSSFGASGAVFSLEEWFPHTRTQSDLNLNSIQVIQRGMPPVRVYTIHHLDRQSLHQGTQLQTRNMREDKCAFRFQHHRTILLAMAPWLARESRHLFRLSTPGELDASCVRTLRRQRPSWQVYLRVLVWRGEKRPGMQVSLMWLLMRVRMGMRDCAEKMQYGNVSRSAPLK